MKLIYLFPILCIFQTAKTQNLSAIANFFHHYLRHVPEQHHQHLTHHPSYNPTLPPIRSDNETYYHEVIMDDSKNNTMYYNQTDEYKNNTSVYYYGDYDNIINADDQDDYYYTYESEDYDEDNNENNSEDYTEENSKNEDKVTKTSNPVIITNYIGRWYTLYAEDNVFLFTGYGSAIHNEDVTKSSKKLERITAYAYKITKSDKQQLNTEYDYYAYFEVLPRDGTHWSLFLNNLNTETAYYKYTVVQDHDGSISVWGKSTTDTIHNPPLDESCANRE